MLRCVKGFMHAMSRITEFLSGRFPESYAHHLGAILSAYNESGVSPPHLAREVTSGCDGKLWTAVWEAILYQHLSSLGFKPRSVVTKAGQAGPDFCIIPAGIRIWIEAVVPSPKGIPLDI